MKLKHFFSENRTILLLNNEQIKLKEHEPTQSKCKFLVINPNNITLLFQDIQFILSN